MRSPWLRLRNAWRRLLAWRSGRLGRRRLSRGDLRGAIEAFERSLTLRPDGFPVLLDLTRAYLRCRDLFRAHRTLGRAREADAARYRAEAGRAVAAEGYDLDAVCQGAGAWRAAPEPASAARTGSEAVRRRVRAAPLEYGDCRDLDEYARFRAMPPIRPGEIASGEWDGILRDLLDE